MSEVTMDQHVEWVTLQVRRWFETEEPEFIPGVIACIQQQNEEAGNEPPAEGGEPYEEAVEYLADAAEEFATRRLIPRCGTALARELVRDALSEADWLELAGQWLAGSVT